MLGGKLIGDAMAHRGKMGYLSVRSRIRSDGFDWRTGTKGLRRF